MQQVKIFIKYGNTNKERFNMNADFIYFDDQLINKRDIIRIYKVSNTDNKVSYGIRLVIRNAGEAIEWYGDNQSRRNERFSILKHVLC